MKTKLMIGLTLAMMTAARIGSAQGYIGGIPGAAVTVPSSYPGIFTVPLLYPGAGGAEPISSVGVGLDPITTVPGDLVLLTDSNAGTNTPNWAADVRFFNPLDPTGQQGLAATVYQIFLPADVGSSGFANYQLLPNSSFVLEGATDQGVSLTTYQVFSQSSGPSFLAIYLIAVGSPVPEPSTIALLGLGGIALALNARRRRT